jgi:Protein of unknown function (DUF4238)
VLQHYIPRFILEGFVDAKDAGHRGVWVYHSKHQAWQKRPTRRTGSGKDIYTLFESTGERDDALEDLLSNVERPAAKLLRHDITTRKRIASAPHAQDLLINFCSLLIARNPATIGRTKGVLERKAKEWLDEITASSEAFQAFRDEYKVTTGRDFPDVVDFQRLRTGMRISATKRAGLAFSIATARAFAEKLSAMKVTFLTTTTSATFITGDVPYVIVGKGDDASVLDQVILPVSAEMTIVFDAAAEPRYLHADAVPATVRSVNRAMLLAAQEIVISKSRDVFSDDILKIWSTSNAAQREDLIRRLIKSEAGA